MSFFKIIKESVKRLYQGLAYWFFWASFVTMRDEMFCSYTLNRNTNQAEAVKTIDAPVSLATADASLLVAHFEKLTHATSDWLKTFMAPNLANLRALMEAAKDLPKLHRARLRFSSD